MGKSTNASVATRETGTSLQKYKEDAKERALRESNNRLLRRLDEAEAKKEQLVEAVYQAAHDASSSLVLPPVPKIIHTRGGGRPEVEIAMLSDWQLGKITPGYDSEKCAERIEVYGDKVIRITNIARADHPVDELHVHLLGDMVEGELIFPGQQHRIDASLYRQVCVDGPRILNTFLRRMSGAFKTVKVESVIGNHGAIAGRSRKDMHPESNADLMLYRIVRDQLAGMPNIVWRLPDPAGERLWYAIDNIGGHRFFLFHGDQLRGNGPGFGRVTPQAISAWASGVIPEPFDYAECGHWHASMSLAINKRILWVNGSTESENTWLQEELRAQCPPSQWLLSVSPEHGVTGEHRIWL